MFEATAAIFIFIAIIAVTALLFGGWLVIIVARVLYRGVMFLLGLNDDRNQPMALPGMNNALCPQTNCRQRIPHERHFAGDAGMQCRAHNG